MKIHEITEGIVDFPTSSRRRAVHKERRLAARAARLSSEKSKREEERKNAPPRIGMKIDDITGLPIRPNQQREPEFIILGDHPSGDDYSMAYAVFNSRTEAEKNLKSIMLKTGARNLRVEEV